MAIIWIDILDLQSGSTAKKLVNHCFNIGSFVTIIREANMNSGIPQCKNCWKWGHTTFACHLQGMRQLKYNGSYKAKHYCHFAWCCKANFKTNSLILKLNRVNLALTSSTISITRAFTKWTPIHVCSGAISLTRNGTQRSTRNLGILGPS